MAKMPNLSALPLAFISKSYALYAQSAGSAATANSVPSSGLTGGLVGFGEARAANSRTTDAYANTYTLTVAATNTERTARIYRTTDSERIQPCL
jgi:hypothetical protein